MRTLSDLKPKEKAVVLKVGGEGAIRRRIMDMGITKGCEISLNKIAPLGDPLELTVRGYELSIRRAEARKIIIS